jgi:hypothetical protein
MRTIKLHTPIHSEDNETQTDYDVESIVNVVSVVGNDDQQGTNFWLRGISEKQFCVEPARLVREMIAEAKSKEEVKVEAEAVTLLIRAAKSEDGLIRFIASDGTLTVILADQQQSLQGRQRSRYNHVRQQLESQELIERRDQDTYELTERGYVLGEFLAEHHSVDKPFHGCVKLPAAVSRASAGTTYNIVDSHVEQLTDSGINQKTGK